MRAARDRQLLDRFEPGATVRFRHALLRDAVVADLSPDERQAWAVRLVASADAAGLTEKYPATVARLVAECGQRARAVELLVGLAVADAAHRAFSTAQETLESACALAGDDPVLTSMVHEALLDVLVRIARKRRPWDGCCWASWR